jgi:hypothetical protein
MWSDGVVASKECVLPLLQLHHVRDCWLPVEEDFQGLPNTLDFALVGGFVGCAVALNNFFEL